jgi:hydroxyacylglutathione hydrolase
MKLIALPAFTDNYIWMLHDGHQAIVVDPGDAAPVAAALDTQGLALAAILVTHHHPDHVGGVSALRPRLLGEVYGPAREAIPQPFVPLADGDAVSVLGLRFQVIDVPGHTAGHIAYFLPSSGAGEAPVLFCGDTLFSGGCGRLFEGTPDQMHASLQTLAAWPDETVIWCAHEYTAANARFLLSVDDRPETRAHASEVFAARERGEPTVPTTMLAERALNPFLTAGDAAGFARRRAAKDGFAG